MPNPAAFSKIDLHLVRVLHTVVTEGSVSRAALKLSSSQPAVSAQLRRLRALTGDALLVRSGTGLVPTATALTLVEPAAALLREAPGVRIELHPLSSDFDYRKSLARGELDLVVGNWLEPPGELHMGRLVSDEIVCLVGEDHPALRYPRGWTEARYLAAAHVAPTFFAPGVRGVIDEHLASQGLERRIAVRSPHFGLIPLMLAQTHLVLTTGRLFCSRYVDALPVRILRCPVAFPALTYYQLWHDVTHASPSGRWLREQVRDVARTLASHALPSRRKVADA